MRFIFTTTVLGGIGLLIASVWPGAIENAVFGFPFVCAWLPLLGSWFFFLVALAFRDFIGQPNPPARRQWFGVGSAAIMFATLGLLWLHIPKRIGFAFCHSALGELVDQAPANPFEGNELDLRVGPYRVNRYAADRRGGVFFRTATGRNGIGPDQFSYGFAFDPNSEGTPFGNAYYWRRHLFGGWYAFAACDDW
jgi:hypothetical protein